MKIIQNELYQVLKQWNTHCIRPSTNLESPSGRPDTSYFLPEVNDTRDYAPIVDDDDIEIAEEMCCLQNPVNGCEPEFNELATIIMEENGLNMPETCEEAQIVYIELLHHIGSIFNSLIFCRLCQAVATFLMANTTFVTCCSQIQP